jgi:hypothetical protein
MLVHRAENLSYNDKCINDGIARASRQELADMEDLHDFEYRLLEDQEYQDRFNPHRHHSQLKPPPPDKVKSAEAKHAKRNARAELLENLKKVSK